MQNPTPYKTSPIQSSPSGTPRSLRSSVGDISTTCSMSSIFSSNMSASYYVVEFKETEEIDIVSSVWLSSDKKECRWPPFSSSKATIAAKQHHKPDSTWQTFLVVIQEHGRSGIYFTFLSTTTKFTLLSTSLVKNKLGEKCRH